MRIGFIGLGAMGLPMARHLLVAGHDVTVASRGRGPIEAAVSEGAADGGTPRGVAEASEVVVLCDTNGGMLPPWIGEIVTTTNEIGVQLGIHTHNDSGCAVANALAAVDAGVMHVQGTVNGYGERTGNAELLSVVANLELKYGWPLAVADRSTYYTRRGEVGYTDFPAYRSLALHVAAG